nr:tyrosine-type recombinase/integrase [Roseofilum capinflatum]
MGTKLNPSLYRFLSDRQQAIVCNNLIAHPQSYSPKTVGVGYTQIQNPHPCLETRFLEETGFLVFGTALTRMSDAGIPLRVIQEISGHRNLEQLQRYLEVHPDQVRGAVSALSALNSAKKPHTALDLADSVDGDSSLF